MNIEILITGDEIRTGTVIDRNSANIAESLEASGLHVVRHTCVGDDMGQLVSVIREIGSRADAAVVTGGLGPTPDDMTAMAAARAAGVDLVLSLPALDAVESFFKSRKRTLSDANKKQAMLPRDAQPISNPVGTAPGFVLKIDRCLFFFLPGVPLEMEKMLLNSVIPGIRRLIGNISVSNIVKTISTFGMGEADVAERLQGLTDDFPGIKLGYRAKFPEIQIKLYGRSNGPKDLELQMERLIEKVLVKTGDHVFSTDGSSMAAVVGRFLVEKKATLAVAESCTGGLISHMLTNVPGSSDYFLFSGVTYSNETKKKVLGVSSEVLEICGAVHEKTAKEMAEGVRRIAGSTYGLATSGIAGPGGGTDDKPVGTVCIGISGKDLSQGFRFYFPFYNRMRNKKIFAMKALDILRRELLE